MKMNHIRWIAIVGLIAIVELQYVWLVNTYKLTKESLQAKSFVMQLWKKCSTVWTNGEKSMVIR